MPSYLPTLREFVEKAKSPPYNCELKTMSYVVSPKGPGIWAYLKRGELIAVLPEMNDLETLTAAKLRSMIAELNLPPLEFWMLL